MGHAQIHAEGAPAAVGPYSHAIDTGSVIFLSGQIGLDPSTGNVCAGGAPEQLARAMQNMRAVLSSAGLSMASLVKTTIFLASMDDYAACNAVYEELLEGWKPARSVVEVSRLPKDVRVEIEGIACR